MSAVPKSAYLDCDRAERKRIGKAINEAQRLEEASVKDLNEKQVSVPLSLMSCGWCHRLRCICEAVA